MFEKLPSSFNNIFAVKKKQILALCESVEKSFSSPPEARCSEAAAKADRRQTSKGRAGFQEEAGVGSRALSAGEVGGGPRCLRIWASARALS